MAKFRKEILYMQELTVEGRGQFPFDMLRYDTCVPRYETEIHLLRMTMDDGEDFIRPRRIHLLRYTSHVKGPTVDRWLSFGWRVVEFHTLPA